MLASSNSFSLPVDTDAFIVKQAYGCSKNADLLCVTIRPYYKKIGGPPAMLERIGGRSWLRMLTALTPTGSSTTTSTFPPCHTWATPTISASVAEMTRCMDVPRHERMAFADYSHTCRQTGQMLRLDMRRLQRMAVVTLKTGPYCFANACMASGSPMLRIVSRFPKIHVGGGPGMKVFALHRSRGERWSCNLLCHRQIEQSI